jgi:hypothetical protein
MAAFTYFGALAVLVFVGWVWFLLAVATKIATPPGALYARRCGTVTDSVWRTVPLSTVIVYPDRLEVEAGKRYVLPIADITAVEYRRNVMIRGIFIHHHAAGIPREIVIYTIEWQRLLKLLQNQIRVSHEHPAGPA